MRMNICVGTASSQRFGPSLQASAIDPIEAQGFRQLQTHPNSRSITYSIALIQFEKILSFLQIHQ